MAESASAACGLEAPNAPVSSLYADVLGNRPRIHRRVLARLRRLGWRVMYGGLSVLVDGVRAADADHPARKMSTSGYDIVFSHGYGGGSESFLRGDGSKVGDRRAPTILATPKWPLVRLQDLGDQGRSSKVVTLLGNALDWVPTLRN